MSATIVFRGLMVLHKQGNAMNIGFLRAPGHVPRILTMKEGVLAAVFDLRRRPELDRERKWVLVVDNPLQPNAIPYTQGVQFNRQTHSDSKDFRFITDLEAVDLHGRNLTNELNTADLRLILNVNNGLFYTRLQSPFLLRKRVNTTEETPYGKSAAVVGCDITFNAGSVKLRAGGPAGAVAFDFDQGVESNTVYEISNAPPDVPPGAPYPAGGHFHMYYHHLFKPNPREQFDLVPRDDPNPAPDPALCGVTFLGTRTDPLDPR